MTYTTRRINFKLYPSPAQKRAMWRMCEMATELYNAAVEQRNDAYEHRKRWPGVPAVTLSTQQADAKGLADVEGWKGFMHSHSVQLTLSQVDKAYKSFFAGGGRPRFKSTDRLGGWGYKAHKVGYNLDINDDWKHGHVNLSNIGRMRMRGRARYGDGGEHEVAFLPGDALFKGANVRCKAGSWHLSVEVEVPLRNRAPAEGPAAALDWGR